MTQTREQIETKIAELLGLNDAAPGWGAAVGARLERIRGLERQLAALNAPAAAAAPAIAPLAEAERRVIEAAVQWQLADRRGARARQVADLGNALSEAIDGLLESRKNSRTEADSFAKYVNNGWKLPRD